MLRNKEIKIAALKGKDEVEFTFCFSTKSAQILANGLIQDGFQTVFVNDEEGGECLAYKRKKGRIEIEEISKEEARLEIKARHEIQAA